MNTRFLLSLAVVAAIFSSCNKDYNPGTVTPVVETPGNYSLASAMAELAVLPKTVTINASTGGTFNGNSGTRYIFPSNAFKTATGATVTGTVEVQVSEYLKKSDMLFSGVLPISNGDALLSGGEINVKATQGGQALRMNPNTTFTANMPMTGTDATGMQLFTATQPTPGAPVNWMPVVDSATGIAVIGGDTISIISNTIDLCNADRFMTSPDYQTFTLTASAGSTTISDDSLTAFTLYDNYNGVWPMRNVVNHVFHEAHIPNIPVHFVVFGIVKGNFYGGIGAATPATGANYTVIISKTTPSAFKAMIDAL